MSKRAIVVLSLVALVLGAYVVVFERSSVTSKELSARGGRVLERFVRDKVDRLELQRKGTRVVLARQRSKGELDTWRLLEPLAAPADQDVLDHLLGELEWLSPRRTLTSISSEDSARFGLDKPRYRVGFAVAGKKHVLLLGHDDVHGEGVYARIEGEPDAHVVPKALLESLDHEPSHFRDKVLFADLTVAWARRLTLQAGSAQGELVREQGRWWISEAPRGWADTKRVDELLHALAELRAARHLEPAERKSAEAALATPTLRVQVAVVPDETREDKTAKEHVLEVAGACPGHAGERYARVKGTDLLVCVRDDALGPLGVAPSSLRDLRLFPEVAEVERVELTRGAQKLALAREGERWRAEPEAPTDREAVERWLTDLAAARATRFAPAQGFVERASVSLKLASERTERLLLGDVDARGEVAVKRGDEPLVVYFPASVHDRLLPLAARFRSPEVWSAHQPSEVVRVEAQAEGRARTWLLADGSWQATPSAAPAEAERVREHVRALVDLRIIAYLTDQPRAEHGVSKPHARLRLALASGAPLSLEIGAATERGALARLDGGPLVEVEREVVGLITELAGGPRYKPPEAPASTLDESLEDEHAHEH